jgi:cytidylate kinase
MNEIEKLRSFIDGVQYREKHLHDIDPRKGRFPFVTISRETGAGGHNLAAKILELISLEKEDALFHGWQICDQEICHKIAQDPRLKVSLEGLIVSEFRTPTEDIISQFVTGESAQEKVLKKMFLLVRNLSTYGKAIIIGRGSVCYTRDLPGGIHVRLVASLPSRVALMMSAHNRDEKWARETIHDQDRAKAALTKTFFHKDIHDPLLYDCIWNTDRVSIEDIARVIIEMIKRKSKLMK